MINYIIPLLIKNNKNIKKKTLLYCYQAAHMERQTFCILESFMVKIV